MAEPFLSEIRIFSFAYAPREWALCNGQLLPINQNQPLFSLLGTTFGGDGQTNFALPDLRSRTPIHVGSGHTLGEAGGAQAHTLNAGEVPQHTHVMNATTVAATDTLPAAGMLLAKSTATNPLYADATNLTALSASVTLTPVGGQAHTNMQPFLTLSFCIALLGIFPSPN